MQKLQGIAVSPGVAIGEAFVMDREGFRIPRRFLSRDAVDEELERLDQADFVRQVIGVVGLDAAQFRHQSCRHPLRFGMSHAVDHAVTHGFDQPENRQRLDPVQQKTYRSAVAASGKVMEDPRCSRWIIDHQIRAAQTDAIDLPAKQPPRCFAGLADREPYTR
jgi:hypothetical protein